MKEEKRQLSGMVRRQWEEFMHSYAADELPKDEDEDDYEDEDEERAWPENAWHDETYFGHVFDAGDHRICEWLGFAFRALLN